MKKIFTLAAIAAFAVAANAQNETVLLNETAMEAQTVVTSPNGTFKYAASEATSAKSDNGYEISFNGVTYAEGVGYSQGSTNVMSWVAQPVADGAIDFSIKMGGNKKFYVIEFDAAKYLDDAGEELTIEGAYATAAGTGLCSDFVTNAADYISYPSISGIGIRDDAAKTQRTLSGSWDGTTPITAELNPEKTAEKGKDTYDNEYEVVSIPAKAGNVYVVGCAGSKLMVRAISYIASPSAVAGIAEAKAEAAAPVKVITANGIQIGKYNIAGQQVK
ncbi:MAG: hypothetical protein IJ183_02725 [Prevotella sp.]|nr:hypothetical protein [Prevotella sp.]